MKFWFNLVLMVVLCLSYSFGQEAATKIPKSLIAGRIDTGPRGLPNPGQAVRKGEVLAYVVPSAAPIERSNQAAQLAELRAAKALADKRIARLQELADTVPRKDVEAAESEAASLAARIAAVGGGLSIREALVAPRCWPTCCLSKGPGSTFASVIAQPPKPSRCSCSSHRTSCRGC